MEKFDVVVIGGGPGGYPAAIRAAQLGAKVALVEKEALGGTCLNWGCIPTKTLIASSELYHKMSHSQSLGIVPGKNSFDYSAMAKRKDEVVAKLKGGVGSLLKANGVAVFEGTASFVSRNKLMINGKEAIEAGKVIIAAGAVSVVPGFIPKAANIIESRKFLELTKLPESMIVLGGGVIGCEFACMAAQLGVKVTIVEMLEDILMVLDADVRHEIRKSFETNLGIKVMTGKPLEKIESKGKTVSGKVGAETVSAEMLLVAIGRKPYTDGLDLAKAGLAVTKTGHIEIDQYCQTSVAGIYAIGDVTAGSTQLAHAATSQGVVAVENAIGPKRRACEAMVPSCIFTSPEVGCAGLSEAKATEKGIQIKIGKFAFVGLGKAMAAGETVGFVKWIVDAKTDQLLGAQAVGAHATELITEAALAIRAELTAKELGNTIHCHPTFAESWMEAAHAVHGECIHGAPKKKR